MKKLKQIFFNRISCSCLVIILGILILLTIRNINKSLAQEATNEATENEISMLADIQGGNLSGEVKLTADTTLTSNINVPANETLTLDLNGYVLKHSNSERHIVVNAGGTLIIKDSNPTRIHYGTITNDLWVYNSNATSGVEITGGIITGGIKSDRGGAIFNAGTVIMQGGTIAGCKAVLNSNANENNMETYPVNTFTNGSGGAIFINERGAFILNGGTIKYCKAENSNSGGGAVFVDANAGNIGTFTMNNGTISNCRAVNGGAVYVHSNLSTGNTVEAGATFEMIDGEISNCYASGTGNTSGGGAIFINATAPTTGSVASIATFNMSGGEMKTNSSNAMGGAVYTLGKFTMSNEATLSGNSTKNTGEVLNERDVYTGFGGAVFCMTETADFVMNGGTITDCKSASGGGVMAYTSSAFTMNSGTISNCSAQGSGGTGNGGAVYVQASTFNFNEGTLENNWARRYGGAININQTANLSLNGACNIINNIANHGGGISQEAGDCQIQLDNENILIKGNKANGVSNNGNGGGLFVEKGTLNISACTIIENSADNNGGSIALRVERIGGDVTVNMTGGIIRDNTANANGGGIDIYADYDFTENDDSGDANNKNDVVVNLKAGTLENNTANENGGGINISINENNGTAVMNIGNDSSTLISNITGNVAKNYGGGICINGGSVNMTNGNINSCSATNGGAVYVDDGDVNIRDGSISHNNAVDGGAFYIVGGDFLMTSGNMTYNDASNEGGAVYANGGSIIIGIQNCTDQNNKHVSPSTHPTVTDNTAVYGGGGFMTDGMLTMYCGMLKGNASNNEGTGNNIYMNGGTLNLDGGTIGEETNPGVVLVGGELNDTRQDDEIQETEITMVYNSCLDGVENHKVNVTAGKYINVPAAQKGWAKEGHTMVGWTTIENAEVRTFKDYKSVGMAVKVENANTNKEIHYYAVWAKTTSQITYNLDGGTVTGTNATSYNYSVISETLHLISPEKEYYNFIGWSLTASEDTKTNWETYYPEGEKSVFYSVENPESGWDLNIGTHFGDITLTAIYETIMADIQINISNSMAKNQSYILNIKGTQNNTEEFTPLKVATITDENGSSSVIIKDIPIGTYTVELQSDWSWRYDLSEHNIQSATNIKLDESQETHIVNFEEFNIKNNSWLNHTQNKLANLYWYIIV